MKLYSEEQVKKLLAEQRHNCQIERNKRSHYDERGWFVHCEDVMNAEEPELPQSDVSGELVDFLTWYIHESEFSKDTYSIKLIVDEYIKSTNFR